MEWFQRPSVQEEGRLSWCSLHSVSVTLRFPPIHNKLSKYKRERNTACTLENGGRGEGGGFNKQRKKKHSINLMRRGVTQCTCCVPFSFTHTLCSFLLCLFIH
jgi:hypothetical protein